VSDSSEQDLKAGTKKPEEILRVIQILFESNSVVIESTPALLKKIPDILDAIGEVGRACASFSVAHHSGWSTKTKVCATTFEMQTVLPFFVMGPAYMQAFDVQSVLADVLQCPREAITLISCEGWVALLVHLKLPIRRASYFDERMGSYIELCMKLEKALRLFKIGATVRMDHFRPDALLPLPGSMLLGAQVELLHYSDTVLALELSKRRPLEGTAKPWAHALFLEWAKDTIEPSEATFIEAEEAFEHYYQWCQQTGRKKALNKNHFGRAMVELYVPKTTQSKERIKWVNGRAVRIYPGIRFKIPQGL
jgi:hypothetical protein